MGKQLIVIGGKEVVTAFNLVGLKGIEVSSPRELIQALKRITSNPEDVGVVLLSEDYIEPVKEEVEKIQLNLGGRLVIGRLPGRIKKTSSLNVQEILKRALGVG